jgi:hypothetical protein
MDDQWWRGFFVGVAVSVAANLALWAIKGGLSTFYTGVLRRPLSFLIHYRRCDCGHWSGAYVEDPLGEDRRTKKTECLPCYRTRTGSGAALR